MTWLQHTDLTNMDLLITTFLSRENRTSCIVRGSVGPSPSRTVAPAHSSNGSVTFKDITMVKYYKYSLSTISCS